MILFPAILVIFIDVVFHGVHLPSFQKCFLLYKSRPTNVRMQLLLISSYFTTNLGGCLQRICGVRLEESKLTQTSLAWAWAELGKRCCNAPKQHTYSAETN